MVDREPFTVPEDEANFAIDSIAIKMIEGVNIA
jgi:hypothetical protein